VAPLRWSYLGQPVLDEITSVSGDVAEDFYACLYEVLKAPRSAPRVLLVKNQPARYMVPFDDALLTYELRPESHQVVRVPVISLEITAKAR
jgi:hypothetical protein